MLAEERRQKVREIIEEKGKITVEDIVSRFSVSAVTARSDLDVLAKRREVIRSHGGAVRQLNAVIDYPLRLKESIHHAEKVRIGQAAAQLIRPNHNIILDSGTTTVQIARQIKAARIHPLTVITNALNVAYELAETEGITLIVLGGILRPASSSMVGPQAERMLQDLHADHLFLGVDGLYPGVGYCTPDILEAQLNALMIRISNEVTVVADASKFGRRSLSLISAIECAHRIITDDQVNPEIADTVRAAGVEVVVV
jgi:DeoR family transcriptional regulator of aga operon